MLWFHMRQLLLTRGFDVRLPLFVERIFLSGGHSVDIFFVLSGFILALTYRGWFAGRLESGHYWLFLRRRFARIYPLHFTLLIFTIVAVCLAIRFGVHTNFGLERFDFATLPQYFLLVQAWGWFMDGMGEWNPPAWSISIEVLAYLLLPVILWIMARRGSRRPFVLFAVIAAIGFACNLITPWGNHGAAGILRGLSEFMLGCSTAWLIDSRLCAWLRTTLGTSVALGALLIACASVIDTGFIIGFCAAPLLLALTGKNPVARFFGWGPIHFLGEISYSIYLGHFLFTAAAWRLLTPEWMNSSVLHAAIGIVFVNGFVIALATLTYYAIERPGRALLSDRHRSAQPLISLS